MENCGTDAHVTSMQFKSDQPVSGNTLSWVQVTLNDGTQSPAFFNAGFQHYHARTLTFNDPRPIRQVEAWDGFAEGNHYVDEISFNDASGNLLYRYDPHGRVFTPKTPHLIKENEEIIGVYGVKDMRHYFTAFGIIVKVTAQGN